METTVKAPAKINLFLRMDGKREDGYHLLYSAFQTLSLADEIRVSVRFTPGQPTSVVIRSSAENLPQDITKNTVYKAATRYLDAIPGNSAEVVIDLEKNIPSQAGLGGGSSDAAAVLLAMDQLFDGAVSNEELKKIAVSIGADVPFFLNPRPSHVTGAGEHHTPVEGLPEHLPILLAAPQFPVSAAWASETGEGASGAAATSGTPPEAQPSATSWASRPEMASVPAR